MKINHNNNQNNKQIYSNLIIELKNYNETNPWSLAPNGIKKNNKNRRRKQRENEIRSSKGFLNS